MSKIIVSPVKRWPGTVTLFDPLSLPQYAEFQRGIAAGSAVRDGMEDQSAPDQLDPMAAFQSAVLPGILACVERVELAGLTALDPFPATPRQASVRLFTWLLGEISALVNEVDDAPNA